MATLKVAYTVCDVCEDRERKTKPYRVISDGRRASVDLCDEHGAPLEELLKRKARKPRATLGAKVSTVEEIESTKRRRGGQRGSKA